jgi:hypothetical protein
MTAFSNVQLPAGGLLLVHALSLARPLAEMASTASPPWLPFSGRWTLEPTTVVAKRDATRILETLANMVKEKSKYMIFICFDEDERRD